MESWCYSCTYVSAFCAAPRHCKQTHPQSWVLREGWPSHARSTEQQIRRAVFECAFLRPLGQMGAPGSISCARCVRVSELCRFIWRAEQQQQLVLTIDQTLSFRQFTQKTNRGQDGMRVETQKNECVSQHCAAQTCLAMTCGAMGTVKSSLSSCQFYKKREREGEKNKENMKNNPKKAQMWDPVSNINIMCSREWRQPDGFQKLHGSLKPKHTSHFKLRTISCMITFKLSVRGWCLTSL